MTAYACRIKQENFAVIASENPNFNLKEIETWLIDHEDGYFIRDTKSPWDCAYMPMVVFGQIYIFKTYDSKDLFHEIVME